jgi:acetyltransferase
MTPVSPVGIRLEALPASDFAAARGGLVNLLRACVHGGASLGFLAPLTDAEALDHWGIVESQVTAGHVWLLVAREGTEGDVVGSGQLRFETRSNGRHRAEVSKLMVRPSHRGLGLGRLLMNALEDHARDRSIRLLVLDTSEGHGGARELYEKLGYVYAGGIPDFALDPDGTPAKNAIFYKFLAGAR